jgi:hypothetical protein
MNTQHDHQVPRSAAIVGLAGIALIHLLELQGKLEEVPYLGVGYILLIAASVAAAALLIHSNSRVGWTLAGVASMGALVGYILTRTVGLPQSADDIGNWLEPMGLASIFIEGAVAAIAGYALGLSARLPARSKEQPVLARS